MDDFGDSGGHLVIELREADGSMHAFNLTNLAAEHGHPLRMLTELRVTVDNLPILAASFTPDVEPADTVRLAEVDGPW